MALGNFAEAFPDAGEPPVEQNEPLFEQPVEPEAPAEIETEAPVEPEAPETPVVVQPEKPEPGFVPLAAILDEREKRQKFEREAQEARRELEALRRQQTPQEIPSIYDDPVAYQEHLAQTLEAQRFQIVEQMSERFAIQAHGAEKLDAAKQWGIDAAKSDPYFKARFMSQPDPFGWLIAEQQRDQIARDPNAYFEKWAQERGYVAANPSPGAAPQGQRPAQSQQLVPPVTPPPRSIVETPSSGGGHQEVPAGNLMEGIQFNLK